MVGRDTPEPNARGDCARPACGQRSVNRESPGFIRGECQLTTEMKQKLIIGIACLLVGLIAGWLANGWRLNEKIEATAAEHAQALQRAEQEARAKEQAWQSAHNELQAQYEQEKKDAESKIADLRRRVQSGAVRMSVNATACAVSTNTGTGAVQTRAELDGKTADDLVAIAADGDRAIRDLNLCIDQYKALQ